MPPSLYPSPSTGEGGVGVIFILRCACRHVRIRYQIDDKKALVNHFFRFNLIGLFIGLSPILPNVRFT